MNNKPSEIESAIADLRQALARERSRSTALQKENDLLRASVARAYRFAATHARDSSKAETV